MPLNKIQKIDKDTCKVIYMNNYKTIKVVNFEILNDIEAGRDYQATLKNADFIKDGQEVVIDRIILSRFHVNDPFISKTFELSYTDKNGVTTRKVFNRENNLNTLCTYQIKQIYKV